MRRASLLLALLLCGCEHEDVTPIIVQPVTPTQVKVDEAQEERQSVAAANVQAARGANELNPEGNPKAAVEGALSVAQASLPDPRPEHAAKALADVNAALRGDLKTANAAWAQAIAERKQADSELVALQKILDAERRTNAEALRDRDSALLRTINDLKADIQRQKDEAKNAVLKDQVLYLNIAGGLFALGFGVATAFGGIATLRAGAWILLPLSLLAFGIAQIVGQAWFLWAVLGAVSVIAGIFIYLAVRNKSVAAAAAAFKPVLKVLDSAYDGATKEVKESLDSAVFDPLSKLMDRSDKATVHAMRAEESLNKPTT
jgi:hypothetical protein